MPAMTTVLASIAGHDCEYAAIELLASEVSENFYVLKRGDKTVSMPITRFTRRELDPTTDMLKDREYRMVMAPNLDHLHWLAYETEAAGRRLIANWARLDLPASRSQRSIAYALALNRIGVGTSFEALKEPPKRPTAPVSSPPPAAAVSAPNPPETMTFEKLQKMAESVKKPPVAPWHHGDW